MAVERRVASLAALVTVLAGSAVASAHPVRGTDVAASATQSQHRSTSFTLAGGLSDVAATSAHNAWAVGESGSHLLIVHWNGSAWTRVASPSPPPDANAVGGYGLQGVAATSTHNAWAVGTTGSHTLILRWNGTAWTQVASPSGSLSSVAATSTTNAWAVGSSGSRTLILHWNGTAWLHVPSPRGYLASVAATSAHNAWAVGSTSKAKTLTVHWNGHSWKRVRSPSPYAKEMGDAGLGGVTIASSRNVWAVGGASNCGCGPGVSLAEHWNGKTWKRATTPTLGGGTELAGAADISKGRTWAVGITGSGDGPTKTVILRRNGTAWKKVNSPHPRRYGDLKAVSVISMADAWAVGDTYVDPGHQAGVRKHYKSLIMHWNGSAWS
jgi:hypothetical protein